MDASPTAAVLAANNSFYTALSLADLALMQRLWVDAPEAVCVHPGWPALHGGDAIAGSWRQIFANQGPLRVWATAVEVRLFGQIAEVNCLENIDMRKVRGSGLLQTRATNVFRLVDGAWKLLEHHALPMPSDADRTQPPPERFSAN